MDEEKKNKLFGQIALKLGYITFDNIENVLLKQETDKVTGHGRHIGTYLFEDGFLTKEQISQILKLQKKYIEKLEQSQDTATKTTEIESGKTCSTVGTGYNFIDVADGPDVEQVTYEENKASDFKTYPQAEKTSITIDPEKRAFMLIKITCIIVAVIFLSLFLIIYYLDDSSQNYTKLKSKTIKINLGSGVTLDMVKINSGKFQMGSNDFESTQPIHSVTISKDFYISKFEITQGQWKAVMDGANPSYFKSGDDFPVDQVTWNDITDEKNGFLARINSQNLGFGTFRLPTEAEWEYACRAGTTTRFYWGDDPSETLKNDYAWHHINAGNMAHPVGQKKPNAWGLFDMSGNVSEWCNDAHTYNYKNVDTSVDPTGPPKDDLVWATPGGPDRIVRGGDWLGGGKSCSSSFRMGEKNTKISQIGFRLALSPMRSSIQGKVKKPSALSAFAKEIDVQYKLGNSYYYGKDGVAKDFNKAFECLEKVAIQGDVRGQWAVGYLYCRGEGVAQDDTKAFEWFEKASLQGHVKAQHELGVAYFKGKGTLQDYGKAYEWCSKAALQGNEDSQRLLGIMYEDGKGVPQDYVMAYAFYNVAANYRQEDAIRLRNIVFNIMSPLQVEKAQNLSLEIIKNIENNKKK